MTDDAEEPIKIVIVRHKPVEQKVSRLKGVTEVVNSRPVRIVHKSSNDDQSGKGSLRRPFFRSRVRKKLVSIRVYRRNCM